MWLLAESIPTNGWETAYQFAEKFGFNALLVLVLLYFGRQELRSIRKAMDDMTSMVTITMLELSLLQPGVRKQLEKIKERVELRQKGVSDE